MIESLQELAFRHPTNEFMNLFADLRRGGKLWSHKRVYLINELLILNRRRKGKHRLPARVKQPLAQQSLVNQSWSMDFMSESIVGNRKFRIGNGPEFTSKDLELWSLDKGITFSISNQASLCKMDILNALIGSIVKLF